MKCTNCGFEQEQQFECCPNCSQPIEPVAKEHVVNPAAEKILNVFKDKLSLVLCILMTVASALPVIEGSFPVINILVTIFLWLTYSKSTKGIADEKKLRCVSGTVYANYVITNVVSVILMVCGVVIALSLGLFASSEAIMNSVNIDLGPFASFINEIPMAFYSIAGWIVGLVFVIGGAVSLVLNLLGMRKIHAFAKSVYQGIIDCKDEFEAPASVKNWLIFYGVMSGLSALASNFSSFISKGCIAACQIIAVVLINKYFLNETKPQPEYQEMPSDNQ